MSDPFHYKSDTVQGTGYGVFTTATTSPSTPRRRRHFSGSPDRHLVDTPQTAFSALGRRRHSISNTEHIELDSLDTTDPFEHHYSEVTFGTGSFSESIQQDISLLRGQGFIIDYPDGLLGTGFYGSVYKGVYGPKALNLKDIRGKPLRNVTEGTPFAAKLVDFNEQNSQTPHIVGGTQEKRESYEMEKYVMTFCDHPNIVSIRMAINMGEPRTLTYRNTTETFGQHDRVYLIMDLAHLGSMMDYLNKHCSKMTQQDMINMTRDCFKGIKYLHDNQIVHGDIHMGNILIFKEESAGGKPIVAKWVDFGLAYVNRKGEYLYRSRGNEEKAKRVYASKILEECGKLGGILNNCWRNRYRDRETPEEKALNDRFASMIDFTRYQARTLDQVIGRFEDLLVYPENLI